MLRQCLGNESIAILTPYRAQKVRVMSLMKEEKAIVDLTEEKAIADVVTINESQGESMRSLFMHGLTSTH